MREIALVLVLLASCATTARPQEQPPQLLIHAARCLATKHFLPLSRHRELTFGYLVDEKSYPGTKEMYVVAYTTPARPSGSAFAIVLTQQKDSQIFDIQNNADFALSKRDIHGVSFTSPPLGGDWTQERLASAVEQIEKQPRYTILLRDILAVDASTSCESYTDPQPKSNAK